MITFKQISQTCFQGKIKMLNPAAIEQIIREQNIQLLIFDCDGTLMDTLALHHAAWNEAFVLHGCKFIDYDEFMQHYAGVSGKDMVSAVINLFGYDLKVQDILNLKKELFLTKYIAQVAPIAKAFAIVQQYSTQLRMVVASGGAHEAVNQMLKLNNVHHFFTQVITVADVKNGKPAPDLFLKAATDQGIAPSQCLVFEDHHAGFDAAIAAGMRYIDIHQLEESE